MTSLLLLALLPLGSGPDRPEPRDVVVVCPENFLSALHPWLTLRAQQGHQMAYVSNAQSKSEIRRQIREVAREGNLKSIVLVGDAISPSSFDPLARLRTVPAHREQAHVTKRWLRDPRIADDDWYADLDDDRVPDVAIGRLPADSPEDAARMVRKVIQFEQNMPQGIWRRRINFVAGMGGFGRMTDAVIEMATKKFITDGIPADYETTMTYGSWRSPFCPDPRQFREFTLFRLNEGCLFWVYIGHGHVRRLNRLRISDVTLPALESNDVQRLSNAGAAPVAILMACLLGAFDLSRDCLAEELLRQEGGPVACLAGSRVTMPYGMAALGEGIMRRFFSGDHQTLGDVVLHAKRDMIRQDPTSTNRRVLDGLASILNPSDLHAERVEHVHLFNLLGDPMLRISPPKEVTIQSDPRALAGSELQVTGQCDVDGECLVELVCRRDRFTFKPPIRRHLDASHRGLSAMSKVYERANDPTWSRQTVVCEQGSFRTTLPVPSDANGPCHLRVFVQGPTTCAMGSTDVYIARQADSNATKKKSRK